MEYFRSKQYLWWHRYSRSNENLHYLMFWIKRRIPQFPQHFPQSASPGNVFSKSYFSFFNSLVNMLVWPLVNVLAKSLVNILADSLVNMSTWTLMNMWSYLWWTCRLSYFWVSWSNHWWTWWSGQWWICLSSHWWTCWPSHLKKVGLDTGEHIHQVTGE